MTQLGLTTHIFQIKFGVHSNGGCSILTTTFPWKTQAVVK